MGGYLQVFSLVHLRVDRLNKEVADMTDYEIISTVIAIITLVIASITLLLKLFDYLDNRYKNK